MRTLLLIAVAALASLLPARSQYFVIHDTTEFDFIADRSSSIAQLATGMQFVEGPVWVSRDGGFLLFSDIPANELKKWSVGDELATFRQPSNNANGNCLDRQGRLITAEHAGRRLSITELDGTVRTLVDRYNGKRLNSPNDVVVKSDGAVWFTDPDYGLANAPKEQERNMVFRFDPEKQELHPVATDFERPNGLCFSPDEKRLFIADSGKQHIRVFEVQPDARLSGGDVFCRIENGVPDGIRCDATGRLYCAAGDGIHIYGPCGALIAKLIMPETPANLAFGGKDHQTLFVTARTSLYAVRLAVKGARMRDASTAASSSTARTDPAR